MAPFEFLFWETYSQWLPPWLHPPLNSCHSSVTLTLSSVFLRITSSPGRTILPWVPRGPAGSALWPLPRLPVPHGAERQLHPDYFSAWKLLLALSHLRAHIMRSTDSTQWEDSKNSLRGRSMRQNTGAFWLHLTFPQKSGASFFLLEATIEVILLDMISLSFEW